MSEFASILKNSEFFHDRTILASSGSHDDFAQIYDVKGVTPTGTDQASTSVVRKVNTKAAQKRNVATTSKRTRVKRIGALVGGPDDLGASGSSPSGFLATVQNLFPSFDPSAIGDAVLLPSSLGFLATIDHFFPGFRQQLDVRSTALVASTSSVIPAPSHQSLREVAASCSYELRHPEAPALPLGSPEPEMDVDKETNTVSPGMMDSPERNIEDIDGLEMDIDSNVNDVELLPDSEYAADWSTTVPQDAALRNHGIGTAFSDASREDSAASKNMVDSTLSDVDDSKMDIDPDSDDVEISPGLLYDTHSSATVPEDSALHTQSKTTAFPSYRVSDLVEQAAIQRASHVSEANLTAIFRSILEPDQLEASSKIQPCYSDPLPDEQQVFEKYLMIPDESGSNAGSSSYEDVSSTWDQSAEATLSNNHGLDPPWQSSLGGAVCEDNSFLPATSIAFYSDTDSTVPLSPVPSSDQGLIPIDSTTTGSDIYSAFSLIDHPDLPYQADPPIYQSGTSDFSSPMSPDLSEQSHADSASSSSAAPSRHLSHSASPRNSLHYSPSATLHPATNFSHQYSETSHMALDSFRPSYIPRTHSSSLRAPSRRRMVAPVDPPLMMSAATETRSTGKKRK